MSKHLSYRTKNPALNPQTFKGTLNAETSSPMTIQGTVD